MKAEISPSALSGSVTVPSSKSIAHRALICAALADKPTSIKLSDMSDDIYATIDCLTALGASIKKNRGGIVINPIGSATENAELGCRESGSTLRFMLPVAAALGSGAKFTGTGRLPERPIDGLSNALKSHGVFISPGGLPMKISGKMHGGRFALSGSISSQFISGLLLALPLTDTDSYIIMTDGIESKPYIEMTLSVMKKFGIQTSFQKNIITIKGGQKYISPEKITVESDWSSAAFFLCANIFGRNSVTVSGLSKKSLQGDSRIADIIKNVMPDTLNVSDIPDLVPVMAAMSCFYNKKTVFTGAGRLKYKESNRLESTVNLINNMGGNAETDGENLIVHGAGSLRGGSVNSYGDHRIAMAAAIAATQCTEKTIIDGCEAVSKSFPGFFDKLISIGGIVSFESEEK